MFLARIFLSKSIEFSSFRIPRACSRNVIFPKCLHCLTPTSVMNNSDTLGVESLTMTPKQSKANKVKRAKQKGKVKGRPIPAPVVEEDVAPRYPLRSFSSSDPTVEATCSQNPSPVPSYTPLNIPPLGTTAGTIAERYLPPQSVPRIKRMGRN